MVVLTLSKPNSSHITNLKVPKCTVQITNKKYIQVNMQAIHFYLFKKQRIKKLLTS